MIRRAGGAALRAVLGALVVALLAIEARAEPTGSALPGLESYDEFMTGFLRKFDIAGGALAVARGDRLLLARGYGVANRERNVPVQPTSLFRLASLSKTVTSVAVLQLVQDKRLALDDKVLPILGELGPRPGKIADPRVQAITVRHLLEHSGGFNRAKSGDPLFMPHAIDAVRRQRGSMPPDCPTVMRDALERKLDFAPGERYAYSNVGYCILGRVIERVAGAGYEAHVREKTLAPVGATGMKVGRTLETAEGEVTYYDFEVRSVNAVPGLGPKQGPRPYAEFAVETMDSYGGWIGSAVDYMRFVLAIDGWRAPALLDAKTAALMRAPAGLTEEAGATDDFGSKGALYALGINVRQVKQGFNLWHGGSLPGTSTFAVRSADGFAWVALFNTRPRDRGTARSELDRGLWAAKNQVKKWPEGDLFKKETP